MDNQPAGRSLSLACFEKHSCSMDRIKPFNVSWLAAYLFIS